MGKLKTDADFLCISHVDSILSHNDKACDVGFIAAYMFHKNRKAVDLSPPPGLQWLPAICPFLSYLAVPWPYWLPPHLSSPDVPPEKACTAPAPADGKRLF